MDERYFGPERTRSILAMAYGAILTEHHRNVQAVQKERDPLKNREASENVAFLEWAMSEFGTELFYMREQLGCESLLGPREQFVKY